MSLKALVQEFQADLGGGLLVGTTHPPSPPPPLFLAKVIIPDSLVVEGYHLSRLESNG